SASGGTPYTCHVAEGARRLGATVVSIANNPDTRLLRAAQIPICLETPPEVLAGSTRMGAGTAQKAALNLISTLAGSLLGHIFEGHMVNVLADNTKLRARTARMVAQITGAPAAKSEAALTQAEGRAKPAILIASGASPSDAASLLETHKGHLGPALAALQT
ncbi:MAG: N-acetylmuramic acid 6-phosphate etherase, partial [Pseudomonadota bacterium]